VAHRHAENEEGMMDPREQALGAGAGLLGALNVLRQRLVQSRSEQAREALKGAEAEIEHMARGVLSEMNAADAEAMVEVMLSLAPTTSSRVARLLGLDHEEAVNLLTGMQARGRVEALPQYHHVETCEPMWARPRR
jgi:hypothetical protein